MFTSKRMKHFIITPFYVRRHFTGQGEPQIASLDWLDHRLELFKEYCLPSVVAQSSQAFEWLIYCDSKTPDSYLSHVKALTAQIANVSVLLCDHWAAEHIAKEVLTRITGTTLWIVTTRLDNDDGLHRDFVANLHAAVDERREFLNFPHGVLFFSSKFYHYRHLSNAFLSLVEPAEKPATVWAVAHEQAKKFAPIRQLSEKPAFLQVIHGRNVSNKPRGIRMSGLEAVNGFEAIPSILAFANTGHPLNIILENVTQVVLWRLRDQAISLVKNLRRN